MSHDMFSGSNQNQLIQKRCYTTEFGFIKQECSEDVSYLLAERIGMENFVREKTKCNLFEFFFHVNLDYLDDVTPENEDVHYNLVVKKVLKWYMYGPAKRYIQELFNGEDVMRIYIKRQFSYSAQKHTFSIGIVSLMNHEGDWGELKNWLANPDPSRSDSVIVVEGCRITIRGEYPTTIRDIHLNTWITS